MNSQYKWLLPILFWLVLLPFTPYLDLTIADAFYERDKFDGGQWAAFLYNYAIIPAHIAAWGGALVFVGSFFIERLKPMRTKGLYLALVLVVGAGLIVNVTLKDHWGQPRPKQLEQFGGTLTYRPIWQPNFDSPIPAKAFPCGHCAMGFYLFAVAFICRSRKAYAFWIVCALLLGTALSLARMAQGGHFFSGVVTSALIMWLTALAFTPLLARNRPAS